MGLGETQKWHWAVFLLLNWMIKMLHATPLPQNPMDMIGVGAMTVISSGMDMLQNGGGMRKDHEIGLPFANARSKTEVGMGEMMRKDRNTDSDEDSDEYRRRRRDTNSLLEFDLLGETAMLPIDHDVAVEKHPHLHRGKRSPCHTGSSTGGGNTGGTGGDGADGGDVEEARRRAQRKVAQKVRSASKKTAKKAKKTTKKKITERRRRRRRQTEVDDLETSAQNVGKQFGEHAKQFAEKVRGVWQSFTDSMQGFVQKIKSSLGGGGDNQISSDSEQLISI